MTCRVTHRLLLHILQDLQEICRLSVAIVGSCWFMLVHVGSCWFMLVHVGSCWFMLVHVGSCWFMLVHVGSCWFMVLVLWCSVMFCDVLWCSVMFCDVLWLHGLLMVGVSGVLILKDPKPMTNAWLKWESSTTLPYLGNGKPPASKGKASMTIYEVTPSPGHIKYPTILGPKTNRSYTFCQGFVLGYSWAKDYSKFHGIRIFGSLGCCLFLFVPVVPSMANLLRFSGPARPNSCPQTQCRGHPPGPLEKLIQKNTKEM